MQVILYTSWRSARLITGEHPPRVLHGPISPRVTDIRLPGCGTLIHVVPPDPRAYRLDPAITGLSICWLCTPASAGAHDEGIVAAEFEQWRARQGEESR